MTRADWNNTMLRWAHRRDVEPDLDQVWLYAKETFLNAWPQREPPVTSDEGILDVAPSPMHHAGLMYIHQLAQDDVGMEREARLFDSAMTDFVMGWSLQKVTPMSTRPYFDAEGFSHDD